MNYSKGMASFSKVCYRESLHGGLPLEFRTLIMEGCAFANADYLVVIRNTKTYARDMPQLLHLSIRRIDDKPIHSWRDLQFIKNELVGRECEGMELFPAESRKIDYANQYHLWVLKDEGLRLPVGFS